MIKYLFYLLIAFNSFIYAQEKLEFTDLYGDYLGQTPPGGLSWIKGGADWYLSTYPESGRYARPVKGASYDRTIVFFGD